MPISFTYKRHPCSRAIGAPLQGSAPGLYAGRRLRLNWSTSWLDFVDNSDGFDPLDLTSLSGSAFLPSGHFRDETWDLGIGLLGGAVARRSTARGR